MPMSLIWLRLRLGSASYPAADTSVNARLWPNDRRIGTKLRGCGYCYASPIMTRSPDGQSIAFPKGQQRLARTVAGCINGAHDRIASRAHTFAVVYEGAQNTCAPFVRPGGLLVSES